MSDSGEGIEITPENIQLLGDKVKGESYPLAERMRAIFTLRSIGNDDAVDALVDGMLDKSVLLAHEVAYCLGQMKNPHAIPNLTVILRNENVDSMVRHEAAEALGAIGEKEAIEVLQEYVNHPLPEIRETCQVAIDLIKWRESKGESPEEEEDVAFFSVDPAPPSKKKTVEELKDELNNHNLSIFDRYRALFKLRNIGTDEAVLAISSSLYDIEKNGALFLHEVCYVLGQLQSPVSLPALTITLENRSLHAMVRHEAAEAIGNISNEESLPLLNQYKEDDITVVKDSCEVALDIHHYNTSNELEYADSLNK